MKKLLLKIHIYGGLIFLPYLIIFGLSTLHINHNLPFLREKQHWTEQIRQITIKDNEDNQMLAESIRDSLGLMGWCPWWTQNREETKYQFGIEHFGSEYRIQANISTGEIIINRRVKGFGHVMHSLHFLGEDVPRANMAINSWKYYLNLTVLYLIVAIISGIYLFIKRKQELALGYLILGGFLTFSISLMIYIWLAG